MPEYKRILLLIGLCLAVMGASLGFKVSQGPAAAAGPPQQEEPPLQVVTKPIEPFVMGDQNKLTGFSIELWQELARLADIRYEFVLVDTVEEQLDAVASGGVESGSVLIPANRSWRY